MAITKKATRKHYMRNYRREKKVEASLVPLAEDGGDVDDLAQWATDVLKVPPGHPLEGSPMTLPSFAVDWLRDVLRVDCREGLLCVARKNAKSAILAVLLLGFLVGPLRFNGFRSGIVSLNQSKAKLLSDQIEAIAESSKLAGLEFRRSPYPGHVVSKSGGRVEILAADKGAGHSSSYDVALVDELGLLGEKDRAIVAGMRSSVSAKAGKFLAISIHGDAPFVPEMLNRRADRGVVVHIYQASEGCELDDRGAWEAANPTLGTIKDVDYMVHESKRAAVTPADQAHFRAHDLNQALSPSRQMLVDVADWKKCLVAEEDLPARKGDCFVGFDLGGSSSMTAAVALWTSGRVEVWGAFPSTPDLQRRGESDGVGLLYRQMEARDELRTYPGRVVPVHQFLSDVAVDLRGSRVVVAGADRYRQAEAQEALEKAGVNWPIEWRGTGASKTADGSHDVRACQRMILREDIKCAQTLLLTSSIAESSLRFDAAGNPALEKARSNARIDPLSALVIACGLRDLAAARPRRRLRYAMA